MYICQLFKIFCISLERINILFSFLQCRLAYKSYHCEEKICKGYLHDSKNGFTPIKKSGTGTAKCYKETLEFSRCHRCL